MKKNILLALFAVITMSLNAQVIYTEINPTAALPGNSTPNGDTLWVDLNNDNQHEYELAFVNQSGLKFSYIQSGQPSNPANFEIAALNSTSPRHVILQNPGDTIDGSQPWETVSGGNLQLVSDFNISPPPTGQWSGVTSGYIGCHFVIGTNWHYGWIHAGMSAQNDTLYVYGYAYNATPDECVIAGDTVNDCTPSSTGIETYHSTKVGVYPNPADDRALIELPAYTTGELRVYNAAGELVIQRKLIKTNKALLNTASLEKGLYLIDVIGEQHRYSGKVSILH